MTSRTDAQKASSIRKGCYTHDSNKTMLTCIYRYATFDQNILCGSRVMSIFTNCLQMDRRTDGQTGSHSVYSAHLRIVKYRNEPHKRTCRPSLYKKLYTCNSKQEDIFKLLTTMTTNDDDDDGRYLYYI